MSQLDYDRGSGARRDRHVSDPQPRFLELDEADLVLPDLELLHPVEFLDHLGALLRRKGGHELAFDEAGQGAAEGSPAVAAQIDPDDSLRREVHAISDVESFLQEAT